MSEKLSTLVAANNSIYDECHSLFNTFLSPIKAFKERLRAIHADLIAVGEYESLDSAIADSKEQVSKENGERISTTLGLVKELIAISEIYDEKAPMRDQMEQVSNMLLKLDEIIPSLDRV